MVTTWFSVTQDPVKTCYVGVLQGLRSNCTVRYKAIVYVYLAELHEMICQPQLKNFSPRKTHDVKKILSTFDIWEFFFQLFLSNLQNKFSENNTNYLSIIFVNPIFFVRMLLSM